MLDWVTEEVKKCACSVGDGGRSDEIYVPGWHLTGADFVSRADAAKAFVYNASLPLVFMLLRILCTRASSKVDWGSFGD